MAVDLWGIPVAVWSMPVVGAIVGWGTNYVAIRMLFHPYRRHWYLPGVSPGLFIKYQDKLARDIGRKALEIFTEEDAPGGGPSSVRARLDPRVAAAVETFLARDRGSLWQEIPAAFRPRARGIVDRAVSAAAERVRAYVVSEDFEHSLADVLAPHIDRYLATPLGELLPPRTVETISAEAAGAVSRAASREEARQLVRTVIERAAADYERRPLADLVPRDLPSEVIAHIELSASAFLDASDVPSLLADQLEGLLDAAWQTPLRRTLGEQALSVFREKIPSLSHDFIDYAKRIPVTSADIPRKLPFRQWLAHKANDWKDSRLDAKRGDVEAFLLEEFERVADRTPARLWGPLGPAERRGMASAIAATAIEAARTPSGAAGLKAVASRVWDALKSSSLADLVPDRDKRLGLYAQVADFLLAEMRTERLRESASAVARRILSDLASRPAGELLLGGHTPESVSALAAREAVRIAKTRADMADHVRAVLAAEVDRVLDIPLGPLAARIPPGLHDDAVRWTQDMVHRYVAEHAPSFIRDHIEGRIREYPPAEIERVIQEATHTHLRYIELVGGIAGFLVGVLQMAAIVFGR